MSRADDDDDAGVGAGCGCVLVVLAIGAVVAAAMSLAAVIDPFDWYPSFDAVWADCSDDYGTERDECALAARFPGFWWHLVANLGWAVAVLVALLVFAGTVTEFRRLRTDRLVSAQAKAAHDRAIGSLALASVAVAALGVLPILVGAL